MVDAGLELEQIEPLVLRLGFEAIVGQRRGSSESLIQLVSDQPVAVRAAWVEMLGRMVTSREAAD